MKKGNDFMFGLLKIKRVAEGLGVPESTLRTWKRRGEVPRECFKMIGGTLYVRVKEFQEWVDNGS